MQTQLTLRMDDQLIHEAKRIAKSRGKSVSQLVGDYFRLLIVETDRKKATPPAQITPWTQSLIGIAKPDFLQSNE